MGFFKSIFSSGKKKTEDYSEFILRTEFKDYSFFKDSLVQEDEIIEMLIDNNEKLIREKKLEPFHLWNISMKYIRKVSINYSMGKELKTIKKDYTEALSYYVKGWDEEESTYADMIDMVSLAILFEVSDAEINHLIDYVNKTENNPKLKDWEPDYLLGYLLNSRNSSKIIPDTILAPSLYQILVDITKLNKEEAQAKMKEYLDKWYGLHKNDPWYNNHKKQSGYKGYWCWDSAAVVKVMGLDDSSFKDHPHYPYNMVHWNEEENN